MNSSNFFRRSSFNKPNRFVTDYSAEEIAAFQEMYRRLMTEYRRRARITAFLMGAFISCIILGSVLPKSLFFYFWLAGICSWVIMFFSMKRAPGCPACHNAPDAGFGVFCPECGSRTLGPSDSWLYWAPKCRSCGKRMSSGKSRRYQIRTCTHCGLMLDAGGF
jgi:hypothetical protein